MKIIFSVSKVEFKFDTGCVKYFILVSLSNLTIPEVNDIKATLLTIGVTLQVVQVHLSQIMIISWRTGSIDIMT